jgi:hypothetical protein
VRAQHKSLDRTWEFTGGAAISFAEAPFSDGVVTFDDAAFSGAAVLFLGAKFSGGMA